MKATFDINQIRNTTLQLQREIESLQYTHRLKIPKIAIQFVELNSFWGKYDSSTKTIFLNEKLFSKSWHQLMGVFLHELAHHLVHVENPNTAVKAHGREFQQACVRLGVPNHFRRSVIDLQNSELDWRSEPENKLAQSQSDRIHKLLSLAQSANAHESALALAKAQDLSKKYFIESTDPEQKYESIVYAFKKQRLSAFESRAVSLLNEHFFVQTILIRQYNCARNQLEIAAELIGRKSHVLIAENALAFVLQSAVQNWQDLKNRNPQLMVHQKNSFLLGFVDGFSLQLEKQNQTQNSTDSTLPVLQLNKIIATEQRQLKRYFNELYPRVRFRGAGSRRIDREIYEHGSEKGKNLKLRKAIDTGHGQRKSIFGFLPTRK